MHHKFSHISGCHRKKIPSKSHLSLSFEHFSIPFLIHFTLWAFLVADFFVYLFAEVFALQNDDADFLSLIFVWP